ncbi:hypothetical protein HYS31_07040 [Candidatus Woesearchaeota archaeon]|nr:hypothetical protein [Candidatus Woesearchaeota archaeon]
MINNGSDWTRNDYWSGPLPFTVDGKDKGLRIADLNNDGFPDFIRGKSGLEKA